MEKDLLLYFRENERMIFVDRRTYDRVYKNKPVTCQKLKDEGFTIKIVPSHMLPPKPKLAIMNCISRHSRYYKLMKKNNPNRKRIETFVNCKKRRK